MPRTRKKERVITIERDPRQIARSPQDAQVLEFKQSQRRKPQVQIVPRNLAQETYLEMLKNPKKYIVFAVGPAGTGKTMLAVQMAIKSLREGSISKVIITRPAVSVDEEHGFLPGDLNAKMAPWTRPIMDVFEEYYHPKEIATMLEDGVIEIAPLAMMRGRNFKNSFIIADEVQNTSKSQMKMLLTRLGEGSRMVVTGDLYQADRPKENGLLDFVTLYDESGPKKLIDIAWFDHTHIERHPVVKEILSIYKDPD